MLKFNKYVQMVMKDHFLHRESKNVLLVINSEQVFATPSKNPKLIFFGFSLRIDGGILSVWFVEDLSEL